MSDIVELLYRYDNERDVPPDARATMRAAAHEIERLREKNKRLLWERHILLDGAQ